MSLASDIVAVRRRIEFELQKLINAPIQLKLEEFAKLTGVIPRGIDIEFVDTTCLDSTIPQIQLSNVHISYDMPEILTRKELERDGREK